MKLMKRIAMSPKMMGAAVILVGLLVGGGAAFVGQAFADGQQGHVVSGTFTTQRAYVPPCPSACSTVGTPYSVTLVNYNVESITTVNGVQTGQFNGLASLAIGTNGIGYLTETGTNWGTVGNSKPGEMSLIVTDVINVAPTTSWPVYGNWVIVQGSGLDGLAGICGSATFKGSVDPTTGAGTFTFTEIYGFSDSSGQCNTH